MILNIRDWDVIINNQTSFSISIFSWEQHHTHQRIDFNRNASQLQLRIVYGGERLLSTKLDRFHRKIKRAGVLCLLKLQKLHARSEPKFNWVCNRSSERTVNVFVDNREKLQTNRQTIVLLGQNSIKREIDVERKGTGTAQQHKSS